MDSPPPSPKVVSPFRGEPPAKRSRKLTWSEEPLENNIFNFQAPAFPNLDEEPVAEPVAESIRH